MLSEKRFFRPETKDETVPVKLLEPKSNTCKALTVYRETGNVPDKELEEICSLVNECDDFEKSVIDPTRSFFRMFTYDKLPNFDKSVGKVPVRLFPLMSRYVRFTSWPIACWARLPDTLWAGRSSTEIKVGSV
jgi:hypothetical protein